MKKILILALITSASFSSFAGKPHSCFDGDKVWGKSLTKDTCYSILEALHGRLEKHAERYAAGQEEHKVDINETKQLYKAFQKCIEKELIDPDVIIMPELPYYMR